jgi:cytochrome c oxidase cbb3-type subunit III
MPRFLALLATLVLVLAWTSGDLIGKLQLQDHQYGAADIQVGARVYASQCALCHGPNGDAVAAVNLRRGQFRRAMSDQDLRGAIAAGTPAAGMPSFKQLPGTELDGLVAFIRAGFDPAGIAVRVGDPARGQALFEGKGACTTCHRVNGRGPRTAPDLSDIGATRTASAIHRSLVNPTSGMLPVNRPVRIVTRDGRTYIGRRLNEDTFTVQLIDEGERLVSIDKSDIREYERGESSPMPPATATLNGAEIADVVAYLLSLRGL